MSLIVFFKAMAAGFAIAAPVGPVGVLCVHRTLTKGRLHGVISGLGAAFADTIYGAIAALGISFVSDFLFDHQVWLRLGGGSLMVLIGIRMVTGHLRAGRTAKSSNAGSLFGDCASAFFITLTNPITIVSFAAVFLAVGITGGTDTLTGAGVLVLGVFAGSSLWWMVLSSGVGLFRNAFTDTYLRRMNYISSGVIIVFGLGVMISLIWYA